MFLASKPYNLLHTPVQSAVHSLQSLTRCCRECWSLQTASAFTTDWTAVRAHYWHYACT